MSVQESWSVDQVATEKRKVSWAVITQSCVGKMHEGEMSAGSVEIWMVEKSMYAMRHGRWGR